MESRLEKVFVKPQISIVSEGDLQSCVLNVSAGALDREKFSPSEVLAGALRHKHDIPNPMESVASPVAKMCVVLTYQDCVIVVFQRALEYQASKIVQEGLSVVCR